MRCLSILACWLFIPVEQAFTAEPTIGTVVPDATFTTTSGKSIRMSDLGAKPIVVVFLGIDCPINTSYIPVLKALHTDFATKGVEFLGLNANSHDTPDRLAEYARRHGLTFPLAKDHNNKFADALGATRTPEVVVLDAARAIRYRGRIDDQYGFTPTGQSYSRPKPTRQDLAEALTDLLADKPIRVAQTQAYGCLIGKERPTKSDAAVTYTEHVAPILNTNCVVCHRPNQLAPFSLTTYKQAKGWGEMIREVVNDQRMPPWHADPAHGKFKNDRSLSQADIRTINRWVDEGMPEGDPSKLPAAPTFADGWRIGTPDLVYKIPTPFEVPATGTVPYQWFRVDPQLSEDTWIQAIECRPGNKAVVHHIIVFVLPPGTTRLNDDIEAGFFAAYAPGSDPEIFPPGQGKLLKKGSTLLFQMHYTTNGTAQKDQSYVGLVKAKEPVTREVHTLGAFNGQFVLPPGAANTEVKSSHLFSQGVELLSFMPHTHLRGKAFRYEVEYPDGRKEMLLNVARYDFNWQTSYVLEQPIVLPKGAKLHCTAYYDNSSNNPSNPDPTKAVRWGPQTWDEMMIGYFSYIPATGKPEKAGGVEGQQRRKALFKTLFALMDKNKDGVVTAEEVPEQYQRTFTGFLRRYDGNDDGKLSKEELLGNEE